MNGLLPGQGVKGLAQGLDHAAVPGLAAGGLFILADGLGVLLGLHGVSAEVVVEAGDQLKGEEREGREEGQENQEDEELAAKRD